MAEELLDVIIVGAGLSGIGTACHLRRNCPEKGFTILEGRNAIGGTWDLFRYPGIRSDSDMYTLGYSFRPWKNPKAIADGPSIRDYIRDTAREYGVDRQIRYGHRVRTAGWCSETSCWTLNITRTEDGSCLELQCRFLLICTGYYNYEHGYQPDFSGQDEFTGELVHPQHWPETLDYRGKRVIVIGSGATAVTLVPSLARDAAQVTMLQRSPSFVMTLPSRDSIANFLRRFLPEKAAYRVTRFKNVLLSILFFQFCRRFPNTARRLLQKGVRAELGSDYPLDPDFEPRYRPWDQRVCFVADGDLFQALRSGSADLVTAEIERFTATGVQLKDGQHLVADVIVTATGLDVLMFGGMQLSVDGTIVEPHKTMTYKGAMLSDVPNMAFTVGYTNASWTLKCDLVAEYVCRLLKQMDRQGHACCTPRYDGSDEPQPLIDFSAGYVQRALDRLPAQGKSAPWRLYQNYPLDLFGFRHAPLENEALEFSGAQTHNPVPQASH